MGRVCYVNRSQLTAYTLVLTAVIAWCNLIPRSAGCHCAGAQAQTLSECDSRHPGVEEEEANSPERTGGRRLLAA